MDTGRFKIVQPEQIVRDERKRAQSARDAARAAQPQTRPRTRVSSDRRGTTAVNREGKTAEEQNRRRVSRSSLESKHRSRPPVFKVIIVVLLIAIVVAVAQMCSSAASINVMVNGTQYSLRGAKTLQTAIQESGLPLNPGDFISLNGEVLRRHEGHPFTAVVNGEEIDDPDYQLHNGDDVTLSDGGDIVEEYDAVEEPVPFEASIVGGGPIHVFSPGQDGVKEIRTGRVSGAVVEKQTVDPTDLLETCEDVNVGSDKVIALTFDDGPSKAFTGEILDVLAENDAKATLKVQITFVTVTPISSSFIILKLATSPTGLLVKS